MVKTFKYRLYPTPEQSVMISKTIGVCRLVYNLALETKIRSYAANKSNISEYSLQRQFTELRKDYEWIREVGWEAPGSSILNIKAAFKSFFNGGGFPKFKSKRGKWSFCVRINKKIVDFEKNTITAGIIKNIPARLSRRFDGEIKRIYISKTPTGKYFAAALVEMPLESPPKPKKKLGIGIDLGIKDFATMSTGEKIDNPKWLKTELQRLAVLQRRASRKKKGSKNRRKANLRVSLLHERIANKRNDFLHKLSSKLISDNQTDTICIETLAVGNMVKNHKLAQAISDVSWSEFTRQLEYKGDWYGKNVIRVDRFFASSKTCSNCGYIIGLLPLSIRYWECPNCHHEHDRDINAAENIRNSGMGNPGEPVELRPTGRTEKQECVLNNNSQFQPNTHARDNR